MEFPDPKPRNIEKDLKVFEWGLLAQALEKILSKYVSRFYHHLVHILTTIQSIYTSSIPETDESPIGTPVTADSPELYELQLSYPAPNDPTTSRFLDQKIGLADLDRHLDSVKFDDRVKFEHSPILGEFKFGLGLDPNLDVPFPSPSPSVSPTSPVFDGQGTSGVGSGLGSGSLSDEEALSALDDPTHNPWAGSDLKSSNELDRYTNLDLLSPSAFGDHDHESLGMGYGIGAGAGAGGLDGHGTTGGHPLDYNIYDQFSYGGMSSDTLASLADRYT